MAGKSTYMRQTALIVLMAQIGSFVPAKSANIGLVDRIFTRVGASDDLASGQSTFMVEMSEVANILRHATKDSLLILDEIGRGTSTFDGLSIAWAVVEYIAGSSLSGAKTLFATHYHELTELEGKLPGVNNYCIAVQEKGDTIIFLRKIIKEVLIRVMVFRLPSLQAFQKLLQKEQRKSQQNQKSLILQRIQKYWKETYRRGRTSTDFLFDTMGMVAEQPKKSEVEETLKKLDISNMTPMEAMNQLYELQKKCK